MPNTLFSGFKPFLIHTSRGKTIRRVVQLKEPEKRIKTVKDADFATFLASIDNLQFRCIVLLMREGGLRTGDYIRMYRSVAEIILYTHNILILEQIFCILFSGEALWGSSLEK